MNKFFRLLISTGLVIGALAWVLVVFQSPALAQDPNGLILKLNRDFGYGGRGEIQGVFTMSAKGPEDLARVEFFIDELMIGEVTAAPFSLRFSTDDYPLGEYTLKATGYTNAGSELHSNEITTRFVSAEAGWQASFRFAAPILILVIVAMGISFLFTFLSSKKRINPEPGTPRNYGFTGGAICPRCKRPTPIHLTGLNMLVGKYDRCENCGKWGIKRRVSLQLLRQAEAEELEQYRREQTGSLDTSLTADEKLKKELENSRFQDLK